MPIPNSPPYGDNTLPPRQLNRWLDVNSQNGPLTRTRGIIAIPSLTLPFVAFNQVSAKVFQLNYKATRNFSLVFDAGFASLLSAIESKYCMFIVNIFSHPPSFNSVTRFRLSKVGVPFIPDSIYSGQKIFGSKFQFEFWNRNVAGGFDLITPATTLYTSMLGDIDYRFGTDFNIHSASAVQVSNFENTNPNIVNTFNLPLLYNINNINGTN